MESNQMNKFLKGFYYAWAGLKYTFTSQVNFRAQILCAILVAVLSWYLNISATEWLWILAVSGLVLVAELANTAIETLVDLVSPNYNAKAGIVKDVSAALVLVSSIVALLTGLIILLPKLLYAS
jgi:diacylglycerol kinase